MRQRRTAPRRLVFGWILAAFLGVGYHQSVRPQFSSRVSPIENTPPQPSGFVTPLPTSEYRMVLNNYCVTCHNERARTAELLLDQADVENISKEPQIWEKVVRKLRTGAMPPVGMPRPDQATYDSLATYLETALDRAAAANPNPGRPVLHRLNRVEYTNAVRDLLVIDIDGETLLPADDSRHGFDNIGDVLTVSPVLLERYLSAARKITRLAIGDPDISPVFAGYNVPKYYLQADRMNEALPFGSRGGIAVRHHFPLDGQYVIKVHLERNSRDYIKGLLDRSHQLDVRLDGTRLELFTILVLFTPYFWRPS